MDCVNHSGVPASAYCQNCGKALCPACVRNGAGGQILCEPCYMAWQQVPNPFVPPPAGAPNPGAAAVLGLIPGVGAMYNGQFFKGLIHVVIFAVLVSAASTAHGGWDVFFGLMIPAWIFYQSFEAYHTARARRDGQPLPDPLGLNELGSWLNLGSTHPQAPAQPGAVPPNPGGPNAASTGAYPPPPPYGTPGAPPYTPYAPGYVDPNMPPIAPACGPYWRRKEPIGAIVLIALGLMFLLGQMDIFNGKLFEYFWPILLIGLGVWLMIRRANETKGGPQ
ncbi:MAG: B-box zinc finger protein [Acidobacteriota bacterium]